MHSQVSRYLIAVLDGLDPRAYETDGGELFDIKEIRAAQVAVSLLIVGVDAFRVDLQFERTFAGILRIDGE